MQKFTFCFLVLFGFLLFTTTTDAQSLTTGFENAVIPLPPPGWTVSRGKGEANWQSLDGNTYEGERCMYLAEAYYGDTSDAWLMSPLFSFEAGKKYSISFYYKNQSNSNNTLAVTLGTDTLPSTQTEVIWQNTFINNSYVKAQINYTATETGSKHIALHCTTPETYTYLYVDNFSAEAVNVFAPVSVTVSNITTTTATATWATTEGAAKYEYGLSETMVAPSSIFSTTDTTAALTGLSAAKGYYFYVRSVAANGDTSSWTVAAFSSAYDAAGIPALACGTYVENSFVGGYGLYNNTYCGTEAYGKEFFHKFSPTITANYSLVADYSNTGQTTLFLYKDSAAGTGPDGWTCIGQTLLFGSTKYSFGVLEAGKTYYIMEKTVRPVALGTSYAYWIDCYAPQPSYDSCQNAISIASSTQYTDSCEGTSLTTAGATSETPGIYFSFKATDDIQLLRFVNLVNGNPSNTSSTSQLGIEIYSAPCGDYSTLVDNGLIDVKAGEAKEILSYKLHKDSTYYGKLYAADNVSDLTFNLCIMKPDITEGTPDDCAVGLPYAINTNTDNDNTNNWVPITDKDYKLLATIDAQGNELNKTAVSVFVNSGDLRKDSNNVYYLNRNFTYKAVKKPASPIKVRLFISNEELNALIAQPGSGVGSISDIRIAESDADCASDVANVGSELITPEAVGDYDSAHKYVEFEVAVASSSFYLRGAGQVLPVTLVSFTAGAVNDGVKVSWKTAAEVNVSRYIVERSVDRRSFATIATVNPSGNDGGQHAYSFTDANVSAGTYYYRLTIVDANGTQKYSGIATVIFAGKSVIAVAPNPFTDKVIISTNEAAPANYSVSVSDVSGKIVLAKTMRVSAGSNTQTLYLGSLPAGVYVVKLTSGTGVKVVKIMKK